jgi:hypothetical protein
MSTTHCWHVQTFGWRGNLPESLPASEEGGSGEVLTETAHWTASGITGQSAGCASTEIRMHCLPLNDYNDGVISVPTVGVLVSSASSISFIDIVYYRVGSTCTPILDMTQVTRERSAPCMYSLVSVAKHNQITDVSRSRSNSVSRVGKQADASHESFTCRLPSTKPHSEAAI